MAQRPISVALALRDQSSYERWYESLGKISDIEIVGRFESGTALLAAQSDFVLTVAVLDTEFDQGPNGVQTGLLLRRSLPNIGIVLCSDENLTDAMMAVPLLERTRWVCVSKAVITDSATTVAATRQVATGPERLPAPFAHLTRRQRQLIRLIAWGWSNAEISHQLRVAPKTVENLISSTYRALGVSSNDVRFHTRVQAANLYWTTIASTVPKGLQKPSTDVIRLSVHG